MRYEENLRKFRIQILKRLLIQGLFMPKPFQNLHKVMFDLITEKRSVEGKICTCLRVKARVLLVENVCLPICY